MNISENYFLKLLVVLLLIAGTTCVSQAVVLHSDGEPASDFSDIDIPDTDVVGRYNSNASCIAIGRNLVITTAHQGGASCSSKICIAGGRYTYDKQWVCDDNSDLRIVKLKHSNLTEYVGYNTSTNETKKDMVLAGYGMSADEELGYGYTWKNEANTTLRFGTNTIDSINDSELLIADFDELGFRDSTEFECIAAYYDSGGGWFIKSGDEWILAGVTYSVSRVDESWFRPSDKMYAWRISEYQSWIDEVMDAQPDCPYVETDLTDDCEINEDDIIVLAENWGLCDCSSYNNFCDGADINQDKCVALEDFARIAATWLNEYDDDGQIITENSFSGNPLPQNL